MSTYLLESEILFKNHFYVYNITFTKKRERKKCVNSKHFHDTQTENVRAIRITLAEVKKFMQYRLQRICT